MTTAPTIPSRPLEGFDPMTEPITPFASVADEVRWVPVRTRDGARSRVGLREALVRAHEYARFDTDSPVELSTLNRFLPAVVALVVREMGGKASGHLDAAAVDAVLNRHAEALFLRHPTTPFAQEWHQDPDDGAKEAWGIDTLRFEAPGNFSKAWKVRGDLTARWMPELDLGVIALHLLCHWFHSVGGNNDGLHANIRAINGSIGSRVGKDLALFWRGQTLADTLLANTPKAWVHGTGLPAFFDRTGTSRGPLQDPHPLWTLTYAPNAILLEWDGNETTKYRSGGSRWGLDRMRVPGTAESRNAFKKQLDLIKIQDPARIWLTKTKKDGTEYQYVYSNLTADQAPLVRLREWYVDNGSRTLTQSPRRLASVQVPELVTGAWTLEFYSAEAKTSSGTTAVIDAGWFECDPAELDFDDTRADMLLAVAADAEELVSKAGKALVSESGPLGKSNNTSMKSDVRRDLGARFYILADKACRTAIADVAVGQHPTQGLRDELGRCAIQAFDEATEPFMSGVQVAAVIRMRNMFHAKAHELVRPKLTSTPTTPVPTDPQEDVA